MDDQVQLPHDVFTRLIDAAQNEGTTPAGWIAHRLPPSEKDKLNNQTPARKPTNMLEALGDAVGSVHSGGSLQAAERHSELFGDGLEEKRQQGRL